MPACRTLFGENLLLNPKSEPAPDSQLKIASGRADHNGLPNVLFAASSLAAALLKKSLLVVEAHQTKPQDAALHADFFSKAPRSGFGVYSIPSRLSTKKYNILWLKEIWAVGLC